MRYITAAVLCAAALAAHAVEPVGRLSHPALSEVSGIVRSERGDFYWVHNDSGDSARVFALDPHGTPKSCKPQERDGTSPSPTARAGTMHASPGPGTNSARNGICSLAWNNSARG